LGDISLRYRSSQRAQKEVMSDHRQAEKPLAIGERRLHTRTPVTPQAFVKFGANNYGFVFNISENGLVFAPTGTLSLAVGAVAKMRFQLPDSKEWIETSGEVVWIAESQKEAGVRFVDLMEDTRVKIRNWISQEPLRPSTSQAQDAVRKAIAGSQPNTPGAVPEDKILKSIFADPGLFLVGSKTARAKPSVQPSPAVANESSQTTSAAPVPERRSQPRRRVLSLEYLDLGDSNGGIILNLGEDGMYIQAVAGLSPDHVSKLSFKIPDSGYLVETSGNIVWVGESRKDAGIQFDNLPEEARLKIREWVAEEFPALQNSSRPQQPSDPAPFATKPAPDGRSHDRLVEMPPSAVLQSPPQSSGFPVTRIADQKPDFIPELPVPEVASPNTQNSKDTSIDYVPPKQPESGAKVPLADVPPLIAANVPAPSNDQKNVEREITAAASDFPDWPIAESLAVNPVADRIDNPKGTASRIGAQAKASSEVAARTIASSLASSESSPPPQSLNWKSIAAAILVAVLLSFAAGWIAAGPGGRKQILDKFASQQSDSSQPPENPGVTSAQTDAPVSGAGLPRTNATTASSEQTVTPTMPQPASQTPRANASTGNVASSAPGKLADAKGGIITSSSPAPVATNSASANAALTSSNKPSIAANAAAPPNAAPLESRTSQAHSNGSSQGLNPSSANSAGQSQPTQPNASAPSSNPPSSVAKSALPPAPPSASSPAPTTAAAEVVKGIVSVNASPFPSIRVPPELKSQISKQGASLQIGQLNSRVEPAYPEDAQHQRIEGVVKLRAIIARDGSIQDIDQMSGPPLLVAAAAYAVRQWHYKPTSLDGQPVEATESITVTFRLQPVRAN
jgi:TonB family protein